MTNEITRNLLTRLAKSVTGEMKHTQKLDAFAKVLGYPDQTALMADLKSKETMLAKNAPSALAEKGEPVMIEVHTDDQAVRILMDARPWLAQATEKELIELSTIDYRGDYAADDIYHYLVSINDKDANLVANYLATSPRMLNGDRVGFEVIADEDEVLGWLKENRRGAWAAMIAHQIIREHDGINSAYLDDLVIDSVSGNASEINNGGVDVQLLWLLNNGYTRDHIERELSDIHTITV